MRSVASVPTMKSQSQTSIFTAWRIEISDKHTSVLQHVNSVGQRNVLSGVPGRTPARRRVSLFTVSNATVKTSADTFEAVNADMEIARAAAVASPRMRNKAPAAPHSRCRVSAAACSDHHRREISVVVVPTCTVQFYKWSSQQSSGALQKSPSACGIARC